MTETLANSALQTLLCAVALWSAVGALAEAEEDEVPDGEFLEYLGMWDESDEEWLLLDEEEAADKKERSDPVPEGKESPETKDEH